MLLGSTRQLLFTIVGLIVTDLLAPFPVNLCELNGHVT
jgi:hypothetical protein